MTPLYDRQSDAFDNPAKMACREGNLRVLREAAFLLWHDGDRTRLRCDWCELMGATGLLTLDLLESQGVLAPGGFVGIGKARLRPARPPTAGGTERVRSSEEVILMQTALRLETTVLPGHRLE